MTEPDPLGIDSEPAAKPFPWGPVVVAALFILLSFLAFWITREKKNDEVRAAAMSALDKELGDDEQAVKAQRAKVDDLSKQVEELRSKIQVGDVKDGKAAIAQFNLLAAQQRAEREKFLQMADAYNQKVAKYRQMEP